MKLGKKRRESSKHNDYIISPRVIIKAIIIITRPSVVIILVSFTHSSQISDVSWILTKPPAGIFSYRNKVFYVTSGVSCSVRRWGCISDNMQPLALRVLDIACFYAWTPDLSCRLGCWLWVDDVLSFASRARCLYFIYCAGGTHGHPLWLGMCLESLQSTMVRAEKFYGLYPDFLKIFQLTLRQFDGGFRKLKGSDSFLFEEFGRKFCRQRVAFNYIACHSSFCTEYLSWGAHVTTFRAPVI